MDFTDFLAMLAGLNAEVLKFPQDTKNEQDIRVRLMEIIRLIAGWGVLEALIGSV